MALATVYANNPCVSFNKSVSTFRVRHSHKYTPIRSAIRYEIKLWGQSLHPYPASPDKCFFNSLFLSQILINSLLSIYQLIRASTISGNLDLAGEKLYVKCLYTISVYACLTVKIASLSKNHHRVPSPNLERSLTITTTLASGCTLALFLIFSTSSKSSYSCLLFTRLH